MISVQTTKVKHTTDSFLQGNPFMSFHLFWHSKAVCRLLLQPPALHASVAGRRVVALSRPRLLPAAAGGPRSPAAPAAVNGDGCWAKPRVSSFMAMCLTFEISQISKEMTSWGVCSGVDGWWVQTFAPLSHLAGLPTVADGTHAVTPGAWRERLDERMNLLSVRFKQTTQIKPRSL